MRIGLANIYVDDVSKAFDFYTTVLGFVERTYVPEAQLAIVVSPEDPAGPGLLLEPNRNAMTKTYQDGMRAAGMPAAAFSVPDLVTEYKRLKDLGVRFRQAPSGTDGRMPIVLEDTCGNLIQLVQDSDASVGHVTAPVRRTRGAGMARVKGGVSRSVAWVGERLGAFAQRGRDLLGERGMSVGAWMLLVLGTLIIAAGAVFYAVLITSPDWGSAFIGVEGAWVLPTMIVLECAVLIVLGSHIPRVLAVWGLVYCAVLLALFIWVQEGAIPDWPVAAIAFLGVAGPLFAIVPALAGILTARRVLWPSEQRTGRHPRTRTRH